MAKRGLLLSLVILTIGGAFCQREASESDSSHTNIQLKLVQHLETVYLHVSFSNLPNKFEEKNLLCSQSSDRWMDMAEIIPYRKILSQKGKSYKLMPQTEGYVQCAYKPRGKTTLAARSNVVFIRFKFNHVSVVKLNQTVSPLYLQKVIDTKRFLVRQNSSDKSVFHFSMKFYKKWSPKGDASVLKYLTGILRAKIKPPLVVEYVRSTKFCPPSEEFRVPSTEMGFFTYTLGQGLVLQCVGNFYTGAIWDQEDLQKLVLNDVKRFSERLLNESLPNIATKFDQLVGDEKFILRDSNANRKLRNELLANLNMALVNLPYVSSGLAQEVRPHFAARVDHLNKTGTEGVLYLNSDQSEQPKMVTLTSANGSNEQVEELDPIRVGMRLPSSLLKAPQRLVVTVYAPSKSLFGFQFLTSSIISATLRGGQIEKPKKPVVLWFWRNATVSPKPGICVSWDLNAAEGRGEWSTKGCHAHSSRQLNDTNSFLDECHCFHINTHFAEIWGNSDTPNSKYNMQISQIGCFIALFSLCGVFLTALVHPHWLKGPGQKILLQMSFSLALLLVMFLVAGNAKTDRVGCFFVGFMLHYAVLSNFSFMAVAGYLQYHRLVRVIYERAPKLAQKVAVVGWGVPVVPGALVLIARDHDLYSQKPLCLPMGWVSYVAILTPLCAILLLNVVIFVQIARNLWANVEPRRHVDQSLSVYRFKQLAFSFIVLGLSWIFGACQIVFPEMSVYFAVLFSGTVAFQGVSYFVFFVLMHDKARHLWKAFFLDSFEMLVT